MQQGATETSRGLDKLKRSRTDPGNEKQLDKIIKTTLMENNQVVGDLAFIIDTKWHRDGHTRTTVATKLSKIKMGNLAINLPMGPENPM